MWEIYIPSWFENIIIVANPCVIVTHLLENSFVLTAAAASFFVNTYHFLLTARTRKAAGIKYPAPYASEELAAKDPAAFRFNCAQRAHGNFVENYSPFLGALLISGLRFPVASAALGVTWVLGRAWYAAGYVSQGPKGRVTGFFLASMSDFALKIMAAWTGVQMVLESA
ncbi:glutathione S-transferase-like protein [Xylariales sp. PMI_506]|nr:glutathione S-transferase-like protein [Xylariales sp. PMI_506]